jgi:hypothetical protein
MQRVVAGLVLVALGAASAPTVANPAEVAEKVHHAGRYPDELDIAEPQPNPFALGGRGDSAGSEGDGQDGDGEGGWDEDSDEGWNYDGWGDDPRERARDRPGKGRDGTEPSSRGEPILPAGGLLGAFGSLVSGVLLVVLLGALLVFVGWLLSRFTVGRRRADSAPAETAAPPGFPGELAALAARDLSTDPDQLARERRFGEAIELLLLQALLRAGWDPQRGESLTARDVVRALTAQDRRRGILGRIVDLAERVRFGGAEPTLDLYSRMKQEFSQLTSAEVG